MEKSQSEKVTVTRYDYKILGGHPWRQMIRTTFSDGQTHTCISIAEGEQEFRSPHPDYPGPFDWSAWRDNDGVWQNNFDEFAARKKTEASSESG